MFPSFFTRVHCAEIKALTGMERGDFPLRTVTKIDVNSGSQPGGGESPHPGKNLESVLGEYYDDGITKFIVS